LITYIAILRGINVSGQKKILMEDLRYLMEGQGFQNVRTYIQSGNIIFESTETLSEKIRSKIENTIFNKYGFHVPVIIRTKDEMENVISNNPFLNRENINEDKLHVTFFNEPPDKERIKEIEKVNYSPDEFFFSDKEVYLHCPEGYGRTKLSNNFIEKKLKKTATTRNWKTVKKLIEIAEN
jgi:uncharacterized protein (DUF1697 family)